MSPLSSSGAPRFLRQLFSLITSASSHGMSRWAAVATATGPKEIVIWAMKRNMFRLPYPGSTTRNSRFGSMFYLLLIGCWLVLSCVPVVKNGCSYLQYSFPGGVKQHEAIVSFLFFWYTEIMRPQNKTLPKAWVVSVDMGYGHQRPAHSLADLAPGGNVVVANAYPGIPAQARLLWDKSQSFYEFISRFKNIPLVGEWAFSVYDRFQAIPQFYPRRDLSKPNVQLTQIYHLIKRRQWGKHLITQLAKEPRPLIATFFAIAFMADEFSYPGEIYCLVTDTDISRPWVPLRPTASRINYFAPNYRVVERLKRYGVSGDRIFLTGFPLPPANTGSLSLGTLRRDVAYRLVNLDPQRLYQSRYNDIITKYLQIKQL